MSANLESDQTLERLRATLDGRRCPPGSILAKPGTLAVAIVDRAGNAWVSDDDLAPVDIAVLLAEPYGYVVIREGWGDAPT